jgi:hypothetical protein
MTLHMIPRLKSPSKIDAMKRENVFMNAVIGLALVEWFVLLGIFMIGLGSRL